LQHKIVLIIRLFLQQTSGITVMLGGVYVKLLKNPGGQSRLDYGIFKHAHNGQLCANSDHTPLQLSHRE